MDIPPLSEVRRITEKKRDAWWTVLLVDPVATPLVRWTAKWTRVTPNQITWGALFLGLAAAACFARGDWKWLLIGAGLYHLSFILDCMDGKLARLTGKGSEFGGWLDYVFDRVRVLVCAVALMGGQYSRTGEVAYVWLALVVVFLDALRYLDALQIFKVRHSMRKKIRARAKASRRAARALMTAEELERDREREQRERDREQERENDGDEEQGIAFMEDLLRENPTADLDEGSRQDGPDAGAEDGAQARPQEKKVIDLHVEFKSRFPWYGRFRTFLLRHRVRTHLVSGIEFQMAVFIVGPVLGAIMPVTIAAGALLMVFELAIIYKLLLSTRDFERTLASYPVPEVPEAPGATAQASPEAASGIPAQPGGPAGESLPSRDGAAAGR
ncbi:CDP-alcohol phosphatidyltransferase family protein [Streptomyces sp. S1A]|uniref:CDP-alcohol phosphatidyltransferase family protein n=1 Tax=Streptomyces sp. ICN903 TaxID=2964654 RepID=UPI001EDB86C6|nr:CDP-alcohol phosphatidyltransferase family protein [Streptomyces sp. ICN903]MCG3039065.1 CDP-alcohol phosphatidyltransferase family protein [Streptomyces sp. ICN903]